MGREREFFFFSFSGLFFFFISLLVLLFSLFLFTTTEALREMPTREGYNGGLSAASAPADEVVPLTAESAAAAKFDDAETATVTKQLFEEGLGTVGRDLLEEGLKKLCADVDRLSSLDSMVQGHE